jgi:hypothetical protein
MNAVTPTKISTQNAESATEEGPANPRERNSGVLTLREVAAELRSSKAHVCHLVAGKLESVTPLPVIRLGRRILVRRTTLEEWKRENEHVASA